VLVRGIVKLFASCIDENIRKSLPDWTRSKEFTRLVNDVTESEIRSDPSLCLLVFDGFQVYCARSCIGLVLLFQYWLMESMYIIGDIQNTVVSPEDEADSTFDTSELSKISRIQCSAGYFDQLIS
jgi:hypothetical protein